MSLAIRKPIINAVNYNYMSLVFYIFQHLLLLLGLEGHKIIGIYLTSISLPSFVIPFIIIIIVT